MESNWGSFQSVDSREHLDEAVSTTRLCLTILENKDALALLSRYRVNLNDIGGNTLLLHLSEINRECKKAVGCCIVLWN